MPDNTMRFDIWFQNLEANFRKIIRVLTNLYLRVRQHTIISYLSEYIPLIIFQVVFLL